MLTDKGLPQSGLVKSRALFTELTQSDVRGHLHLVCRIFRDGALVLEKKKKDKNKGTFRRPFGVAVLTLHGQVIDKVLAEKGNEEVEGIGPMEIYVPENESDFLGFHQTIIDVLTPSTSPTAATPPVLSKAPQSIGIALGLRVVFGNTADRTLLSSYLPIDECEGVAMVPKTVYPGPKPGQVLNELLLTLVEGSFVQGLKSKKSEKNVQVTIELRDQDRQPIPNCIRRGKGNMSKSVTTFSSTVYYHNNTPAFKERVAISLPPQRQMEACHLFFQFAHASTSEKQPVPFGYAYILIITPRIYTVIKNGGYALVCYEYSKKHTPSDDYLMLEEDIKDKLATREKLIIQTELHSTLISQDVDIHQLLNWHRSPKDQRRPVISALSKKEPQTLCHNLSAVMNKLVEIMTSSNKEYVEMHKHVYASFVHVISVVGERKPEKGVRYLDAAEPLKYPQPYLEHYVEVEFTSPVMFRPLLEYYRTLVQWVNTEDASTTDVEYTILANSMKGIDYILRLVVKSFNLHLENTYPLDSAGNTNSERESEKAMFAASLSEIFRNINVMMTRSRPTWLLPLQVDAAANIRAIFSDLRDVLAPEQVVPIACDYVSHIYCANETMSRHKLSLFHSLLRSQIVDTYERVRAGTGPVSAEDIRSMHVWARMYIPHMIRQLFQHMSLTHSGDKTSADEKWNGITFGGSVGRIRSESRVRSKNRINDDLFCLRILYDLLPYVQEQYDRDRKDSVWNRLVNDLMFLFPDVLRILLDVLRPEILEPESYAAAGNPMKTIGAILGSPSAGPKHGRNASMPFLTGMGGTQQMHRRVLSRIPSNRTLRGLQHSPSLDDEKMSIRRVPSSEKIGLNAPPARDANPYNDSNLFPELRGMDVNQTASVVAMTMTNLLDSAKFTGLINNLEDGAELLPLVGVTADDDMPPPPPPAMFGDEEEDGMTLPPPPPPPSFAPPTESSAPFTSDQVFQLLYNSMSSASELVECSTFKQIWLMMRMQEVEMGVNILKWCGPTLCDYYMRFSRSKPVIPRYGARGSLVHSNLGRGEEGREKDVWEAYWLLGMSLLTSEDLELESVSDKRREFVMEKYGDLRVSVVKELEQTWAGFENKQVQFMELLTEPIITLACSPSSSVCALAKNMYWDLVQAAMRDKTIHSVLQSHTIDAVGNIVHDFGLGFVTKSKLDSHRRFFAEEMKDRLLALPTDGDITQEAKNSALHFLTEIHDLVGHLLSLESLRRSPQFEDQRTDACLNLMAYLKSSGKGAMHEKYLQYLGELHYELENHLERGLVLLTHASIFKWTSDPLEKLDVLNPREGSSRSRAKAQVFLPSGTERSRKIDLLKMALASFEKVECWEKCIDVCKLLADAYENRVYNFAALADILHRRAQFTDSILRTDRIFRAYYRVRFYGSFDDSLRDKEFVYRSGRGSHLENVREFTERLKSYHPNAEVVNSSDIIPPPEDGKCVIQITTLTPSSLQEKDDLPPRWADDLKPPVRMLRYMREHDTNVFTYTRVEKKDDGSGNELRCLWICKTFLITENELPGLSRRMHVVERYEVMVSPIASAVQTIQQKNRDLEECISVIQVDAGLGVAKLNMNGLSMQLNGVIDAAVNGGISKYREAFFDSDYLSIHTEAGEEEVVYEFKTALREQLRLLKVGLSLFERKCDESLKPLCDHLTTSFRKMIVDLSPLIK